jgi:pimeloyl-ACP methyl ester carboxylesterase
MFKTSLSILAILCLATGSVAQETNVFRIRAGSVLTGTEEYRITSGADGYRVSGTFHGQRGTTAIDMTHDETLAPDRTLVRYKLEVAGQVIEAWRDGDQIQIKASAGAQSQSKTVPFTAATVLVDNLVTAHLQVLLDRVAGSSEPAAAVTFLVPQAMAAIPGKVSRAGEESASLDGKPVRVRKYTIEVANLLEEMWAAIGTNRLMRVTVPVQNVEIVRDGFAPAAPVEPATRGPAAFTERPLDLVNGDVKLPAVLCLPTATKANVPLLVLVHGSGPNDRDETIGPNKPFRDLAEGLAAAGIGTLRYDKRTFALKGKLDVNTLTVEEETLADAVAAVNLARTLPEVDPARVFVLGHSQGAMFGPVIAERSRARGAILMAPAERPIDEVVAEQLTFQLKVAGQPQSEIDTQISALKQAFARVRSGEAKDGEMVFGGTARYWRDMFARDLRAALTNATAPVLLLQGGMDVQVLKADYDIAQQALASKPPSMREAHFFPTLNHLFMPVEGQNPTGAEYGRASHVAPEVIRTIAAWVAKWK